mgnify:FL=1
MHLNYNSHHETRCHHKESHGESTKPYRVKYYNETQLIQNVSLIENYIAI